jgi:[ribosomal protein S5]-alanine N-acetyltransferase
MTRMHGVPALVPGLETARLWLRPLELADAEQAQPLFAQWDVVRYLNDKVPWPFPADGVHAYYRDNALPAMARGDEWHWTLRLKSEPETLIGSIGLMKSKSEGLNRGFWLAVPWRGQGLMSEAAEAVNDYWFCELGFSRMRVQKAALNRGSCRISQRNGMRLMNTTVAGYVCGPLETEIWEMTAEEWRARRARLGASLTPTGA